MNRRSFLSVLGPSLVAINLTLGFRPTTVKFVEPLYPANEYRMVVWMTALEDLEAGRFVVRVGDEGVKKATKLEDRYFGIVETSVKRGERVCVCTQGVALSWMKV